MVQRTDIAQMMQKNIVEIFQRKGSKIVYKNKSQVGTMTKKQTRRILTAANCKIRAEGSSGKWKRVLKVLFLPAC